MYWFGLAGIGLVWLGLVLFGLAGIGLVWLRLLLVCWDKFGLVWFGWDWSRYFLVLSEITSTQRQIFCNYFSPQNRI